MRRGLFVLPCLLLAPAFAAPSPGQLITEGDQSWHQDQPGVSGSAETEDHFGNSVATGDFNGDGFLDLATGIPDEAIGSLFQAGAVQILYGGEAGLGTNGEQFWSQDSADVPETAEASDHFGSVLAAGDLDCDGFDDLAIGVPNEDVQGLFLEQLAGRVHVFWGSAAGLTPNSSLLPGQFASTLLDEDDFSPDERLESWDQFGASLAIGSGRTATLDRFTFLAIGAPGEDVGTIVSAGTVFTYTNSCGSRSLQSGRILHQDAETGGAAVAGTAEANDRFGSALAAGDFNGDALDDLAVGVVREDIAGNSLVDAGALAVFYSASSSGPRIPGNQLFDQSSPGMAGIARADDNLGSPLVSGDFDGDGRDDLAVGIPNDRNADGASVGGVLVLYGGSTGLDPAGSQAWNAASFALPLTAGEGFGQALAAGNFDGDTEDDLAIGVPFADVGAVVSAGRLHVLYGAFGGLGTSRTQLLTQGAGGLQGGPEDGDHLGYALAAGDFDGNGEEDLAIGVPQEDLGSVLRAGMVAVAFGSANGAIGQVRFAGSSSSAPEPTLPSEAVSVELERTGSALLASSVEVGVSGGSATAGSDFTFSPLIVSWAAGESGIKTIPVTLLRDFLEEGNETIRLALANSTPTYPTAAPTQHTVTILDDDEGGVLAFPGPSFAAFESSPLASLSIARSGGAASGVTVQYTIAAGTATAGADFTLASGSVTFGPGETSRGFTAALLDDVELEDYETVLLSLSSPTGGATLGARSTAVLYLRDDDSPGIFRDDLETGTSGRWSAKRP